MNLLHGLPNADVTRHIQKVVLFRLAIIAPIFIDYRELVVSSFGPFNVKIILSLSEISTALFYDNIDKYHIEISVTLFACNIQLCSVIKLSHYVLIQLLRISKLYLQQKHTFFKTI